ncbi:coiled-coil domain-containing protein 86 isoform X2 [Oryzias melastigma]|uniref:coiled-coil domain-containing protein 86 isoform X2 n=1 Tax=Oryzias melastigma TaxID=30732 RepID=UPI00168D4CE5|nr:coiled-coil domain-containing protein 86 isoform X2 [Oryzias melastigma]
MPKRVKPAVVEENPAPEAVPEEEPRRTRSGRRLCAPAAPVKTPSRRTRRSVLQELPTVEAPNTVEPESKPSELVENESSGSTKPELEKPDKEPREAESGNASGDDDVLKREPAETAPASSEIIPKKKKKKPPPAPNVKQSAVIPLGKPKSGRVWKDRSKQRFSALLRDKPLCSSWEKKMEAKREKELLKAYALKLKEENARQKEDKRKRREENLKRRAENERKAEIVQVIRNTTKIKRMKKKQLRKIEKRDTLALLQKNQNTKTHKDIKKDVI